VFATEAAALRAGIKAEAAGELGAFLNPDARRIRFQDYATEWIADRRLSPSTVKTYTGLLDRWLVDLHDLRLAYVTAVVVRKWNAALVRQYPDSLQPAKAYRLLHAICHTAIRDGLIHENPSMVEGAGVEDSPERPVAAAEAVLALADAVRPRWKVLVLTAAFCSPRWGELAVLRRRDVDLVKQQLRLAGADDGTGRRKRTKGGTGGRTVAIPSYLVPALTNHLAEYVAADPNALVFTAAQGGRIHAGRFHEDWTAARKACGIDGLHFHDLRHTGNTWFAETGATTKEMMARMGHSSRRAAEIYMHARDGSRQAELTARMDERITAELDTSNVVAIGSRR
jgi:integrase